jgi:serine protease Do
MSPLRLPTWTGVVIGLLAGALIGALLLLVNERTLRARWEKSLLEREAALREMVVSGDSDPAADPEAQAAGLNASRRNAIVVATEKVAPTVVSISARQRQAVSDPRLEFWQRYFPGTQPRRQFFRESQSYGSGVIVSSDGYVVTNAHVVGSPLEIQVTLTDGRSFPATLLDSADRFDLAILQIDAPDLPVAKLANSDDLQIGEWVIAVGSPFGYLLADTQPTVTVGVVSAVNRDIVRQQESGPYYLGMIQTDAAINQGNSGGPLANTLGEVVGINTFIFSETGGSIGIGFAVPSERIRWVIEEVREFGHYREVNWGLTVHKLSPQMVRELNLKDPVGFLVGDVTEGSPAWKAGLRPYDVLRSISGRTLDSRDTVTRLIYEAMVGDRVPFKAERDGRTFSGVIELEEAL